MKIDLQFPVEVEGKRYEFVTLRRIRGRDMRVMDKYSDQGSASSTLDMIASVAGIPVKAVDEFDAEDIARIGEKLVDFFPKTGAAPATGEAS